jgi:amino acid transporter
VLLLDLLFGRPLASGEDNEQRVGAATGIPIFGLDALGSSAYGPEAALTILIPLGLLGVNYILPIVASIVVLLAIVYFSYRQTIAAYPTGGGSYTVARLNLGARAGLFAAAALMIDYLLNVAVGISAGVGALVSAAPSLQPMTLPLCLGILAVLTLINLRGMREAGLVLTVPTYLFIGCLLTTIAIGVAKTFMSGGHPTPLTSPPKLHMAAAGVSAWLILKAFSSGCTAMTGVEAVSNGVQAFQEPVVKCAQRTLTVIIALLMVTLLGIAYLAHAYHIGANDPGKAGYESLLSQLIGAVAGKGIFYYVSIGSILLVLALSANTSFADFPRLCRAVANNGYLPYGFRVRGRRLVYTYGVYSLAALSAVLLIVFGGVTDRLIPLFAIGAFLSFTLSQAGMVMHWRKHDQPNARRNMIVNGVGAVATGATAIVVMVAKFTEGAWITLLMIPALLLFMTAIRRHYHQIALEVARPSPTEVAETAPPIVVVPVDEWNRITRRALRFALKMSQEVKVLHVKSGDESSALTEEWNEWPLHPGTPELVVLDSPYRAIVNPILNYVVKLEKENPERQVAVVLSELVEGHWFQQFLHNQRASALTKLLKRNSDRRVVIVNVPWYFQQQLQKTKIPDAL